MSTGPGLLALVDVRAKAEAILDAALSSSPELGASVIGPADAVEPPALRVGWAEPWLEPFGRGPLYFARLEVLCIGDRIEPRTGFEVVESLVAIVSRTFASDAYPWPINYVGAPRGYDFGGKSYLASQIVVRVPTGGD